MIDEHNYKRVTLGTVNSTSTFLHEYQDQISYRITVASAEYQTAGRGATGGWESEEGKNLTFSILVHPTMVEAQRMFVLSEAIALALCDTLNGYRQGFQIKWPNDIYFEDKKIVGMLIENNLRGAVISNCILGIGVNVNQTVFRSDAPNPSSLALILDHEVDREEVLQRIIETFDHYLEQVEQGDFVGIHANYLSHLYRKGEEHSYSDSKGEFRATLLEVEPTGHLVLRDAEGKTRKYAFKEVKYVI